jgi:uncharacterized membrane protein
MLDVLINQSENKQSAKQMFRFSDRADKPIKSLIKAISWRVVGTIDTMIISYFITGKIMMAVSIGGVEVFSKTLLYYFHERIWAHIHRIRRFNLLKSRKKNLEQIEYGVKGIKRAAVR